MRFFPLLFTIALITLSKALVSQNYSGCVLDITALTIDGKNASDKDWKDVTGEFMIDSISNFKAINGITVKWSTYLAQADENQIKQYEKFLRKSIDKPAICYIDDSTYIKARKIFRINKITLPQNTCFIAKLNSNLFDNTEPSILIRDEQQYGHVIDNALFNWKYPYSFLNDTLTIGVCFAPIFDKQKYSGEIKGMSRSIEFEFNGYNGMRYNFSRYELNTMDIAIFNSKAPEQYLTEKISYQNPFYVHFDFDMCGIWIKSKWYNEIKKTLDLIRTNSIALRVNNDKLVQLKKPQNVHYDISTYKLSISDSNGNAYTFDLSNSDEFSYLSGHKLNEIIYFSDCISEANKEFKVKEIPSDKVNNPDLKAKLTLAIKKSAKWSNYEIYNVILTDKSDWTLIKENPYSVFISLRQTFADIYIRNKTSNVCYLAKNVLFTQRNDPIKGFIYDISVEDSPDEQFTELIEKYPCKK